MATGQGGRPKITDDQWRDVLGRLVLAPKMNRAARESGINPTTMFAKIKASVADPEANSLDWLGHRAPFHQHIVAARRLNVVALDHSARDLAVNGHVEARFFNGKPVWRIDPKVEADAITLDELDWVAKYNIRPRTDTFARDAKGALIQETITHPPNPAILVKLLTSLAPEIYGERSTIEHHHSGGVMVEGQSPTGTPQLSAPSFNEDFGLVTRATETARPTNVLSIPRPCVDSAEFDRRFRGKLVREVVLFRDTEAKLLPPLPDDVVVAGTPQARAFEDAKIDVKVVRAEVLLDEGYTNEFLRELAPSWKPPKKLTPTASPTQAERDDVAAQVVERIAAVPPGRASARADSENIGYGRPKPGGRRIVS